MAHSCPSLGIALLLALVSAILLVGLAALAAYYGLKKGWWKE
jgi:hypothetical protein